MFQESSRLYPIVRGELLKDFMQSNEMTVLFRGPRISHCSSELRSTSDTAVTLAVVTVTIHAHCLTPTALTAPAA